MVVPSLLKAGFQSGYGGFPAWTTWAGWSDHDVKAVLDYILLKGALIPRACLDVPKETWVLDYPDRLPNPDYPSDHICLVVDVELPRAFVPPRPIPKSPVKTERGKTKEKAAFVPPKPREK